MGLTVRLSALVVAGSLALAGCTDGSPTADDPGPTAPTTSSAPDPADPSAADLARTLDGVRTSYGAPGAIAVVVHGATRVRAAVGDADLAGTPAAATMRFRIASITKPLVAVLALQAVDDGALTLDEPIAPRTGGALRPDPPVTLPQLLSHTAGVFEELNDGDPVADVAALTDPALLAEATDLVDRAQAGEAVVAPDHLLVALAETHDRSFAPGDGYHYSNSGYQVVGMALGQATGRTMAELLEAGIVAPLGLEHTTLAPFDRSSPELRGHDLPQDGSAPVDVTDDLTFFGNGANGGVLTTPDELATVFVALMQGRLVPQSRVDQMVTPSDAGDASGNRYGLGLGVYQLTCGTFYGHEGGVNGTASIALVDRSGENAVVVALNGRSAADPHMAELADRLVCADTGA